MVHNIAIQSLSLLRSGGAGGAGSNHHGGNWPSGSCRVEEAGDRGAGIWPCHRPSLGFIVHNFKEKYTNISGCFIAVISLF